MLKSLKANKCTLNNISKLCFRVKNEMIPFEKKITYQLKAYLSNVSKHT